MTYKGGNRMEEKEKMYCNLCGRELKSEKGILKEDALFVKKDWGYFSKRDLEVHEFILCESCYEKITGTFVLPVKVSPKCEVLGE